MTLTTYPHRGIDVGQLEKQQRLSTRTQSAPYSTMKFTLAIGDPIQCAGTESHYVITVSFLLAVDLRYRTHLPGSSLPAIPRGSIWGRC